VCGVGSHAVNAVAGLIGGAVGGAVSTPFDVVRVRQQAEGAAAGERRRYGGSLWRALARLARREGVAGLFRGVVPRMLGAAPSTALMLVGYEFVKNQCMKSSTDI
jgi:hypothetical protein